MYAIVAIFAWWRKDYTVLAILDISILSESFLTRHGSQFIVFDDFERLGQGLEQRIYWMKPMLCATFSPAISSQV